MNRRKIDYMLKNMPIDEEKKLLAMIDIEGHNAFNSNICDFLIDPTQKDVVVLAMIPGALMGQENIYNFISSYVDKFKSINELCVKNKIYPLFDNPNNVAESVETREDILDSVPEAELNVFFKTESYDAYQPPVYEPSKGDPAQVPPQPGS